MSWACSTTIRAKQGRLLRNVSVLGPISELSAWTERYGVRKVIIALPAANHVVRRRVAELCAAADVEALTVPSYEDLISGRSALTTLRNVELDDLLGRDPVVLDNAGLAEWLGNRVVMVTGAGGSIGAELTRQIARFRPARIVLFDISEAALYEIQTVLNDAFPQLPLTTVVGDVKHQALVEEVLARERPSVIFHAGAYKHVPLMEETNAWQAVRNNAWGTWVLARAAVAAKVEKFVLVSSDKAVNPTNVMGATKRLAEIVCQSLQGRGTQFVLVRFGNVFGSAGSVIPRFREQIARGGPVTVTHPEITRYFMSLSEATQLLLQAGLQGKGGEILVLDMGEPVRIVDLARDLIKLSGADPDKIAVVFTGPAAGRKAVRGTAGLRGGDQADAAPQAAHRAGARGESRSRRPDGHVVRKRSRGRRRRSARAPQGLDPGIHAAGGRARHADSDRSARRARGHEDRCRCGSRASAEFARRAGQFSGSFTP